MTTKRIIGYDEDSKVATVERTFDGKAPLASHIVTLLAATGLGKKESKKNKKEKDVIKNILNQME